LFAFLPKLVLLRRSGPFFPFFLSGYLLCIGTSLFLFSFFFREGDSPPHNSRRGFFPFLVPFLSPRIFLRAFSRFFSARRLCLRFSCYSQLDSPFPPPVLLPPSPFFPWDTDDMALFFFGPALTFLSGLGAFPPNPFFRIGSLRFRKRPPSLFIARCICPFFFPLARSIAGTSFSPPTI